MDGAEATIKKRSALRRGVIVAVVLAVLTAIEYVFGVVWPAAWLLLLISLVKAVIVIQYYMHVSQLFSSGQGGH